MISSAGVLLRKARRFLSRSEFAIRLLQLSRLKEPTDQPGLVMVQIDGLSLNQFHRASQRGHLPFLNSLLKKERYVLHSFYSGLPSNTPNVQAEIFYGVKSCVPAFHFVDRKSGRPVRMNEVEYVAEKEAELKAQAAGLLVGGSSYSNIFSGGAEEAHFCWSQLGWGGVWRAINPLVFPFLIILYIDIFLRTFVLLVIEFFLAVSECIRGTIKGRLFFRELELVWLRVLVCVFLRELVVAGVCMDIIRGRRVIHLNFLGYDEQAHGRGPSSRFAHWSLEGIDNAIRRINHVIGESPYRKYDLWVYSDHGQEKTVPYLVKFNKTFEEAVKNLFDNKDNNNQISSQVRVKGFSNHMHLVHGRIFGKRHRLAKIKDIKPEDIMVTAMGPLGHVYLDKILEEKDIAHIADKIARDLKVPLVLRPLSNNKILAWTPQNQFQLPQDLEKVFGRDHPFLSELREDIFRVCFHPDAGELIVLGWSSGEEPISFPLEYGAHAGASVEETNAFALLPVDAPLETNTKNYLRPENIGRAARNYLEQNSFFENFTLPHRSQLGAIKTLRIMSYNVHGCKGMDGVISTARISRVIARYQPDIVALQELDVGRLRSSHVDQVEKIAQRLEMSFHFHPTFRFKDGLYGNAILSHHPMALIKQAALPALSNHKIFEPRGAIWTAVEYKGVKINIINTHLSLWPQEQALQVDALLGPDWLGHSNCEGPTILCGDFNLTPREVYYSRICQRLRDSQSNLDGHKPHQTWFTGYPFRRIDYVFMSADLHVKHIELPHSTLEKMASDHLPLIVQFDLGK